MRVESQRKYNICDLTKEEFSVIRNALDCYARDCEVDLEDRMVAGKIWALLHLAIIEAYEKGRRADDGRED